MSRHARAPSMSILPPPTQAFLQQIHQTTSIPYTALPAVPTQIVLLQDQRYTFSYLGVTSVGASPYRHFSLWDGWMEREWSVYALDSTSAVVGGVELKRTGSMSSSSTGSGTMGVGVEGGRWYSGAGVMGTSERRALKNEEVRNALTAAFLQLISRSLPSMDIVI